MSNSIDLNLREGNSIPNLSFIWIARFKDDTIIHQYENNTEHRFQEVLNRFSDLTYFTLYNKCGKVFTVDLINGLIFYDNHLKIEDDLLQEKRNNIRLIFFRRHRVLLTEKRIEKNDEIIYFLGFQYQDNQLNNRKIILQINSEGRFIVGD